MTVALRTLPRLARSGRRPLESLDASAGLELLSAHRGRLRVGEHSAEVRVEGGDLLRARLPLEACGRGYDLPAEHHDLLATQEALGGNVRLARARQGWTLLADTWVDGTAHLPRSLTEIARGFATIACAAPGARAAPEHGAAAACSSACLADAVEGLRWEEDAVVPLADGWQLRPRIGGVPIAVRLEPADGGLRLRRRVLERVPSDARAAALCDLALRLNARLRLVRLTRVGDALVAESRAHVELATPAWIALLARAVASAYQYARAPLEILATDPRVADGYARCFLDR